MNAVSPDTETLEEILTRGVERVYPSKEFLARKLMAGEPVRLYLGVDPTGPTLHLGHAVILLKLSALQKLGHEVVLLVGDFTGMVGDPTDKTATRVRLTSSQVLANAKRYKKQASRFLSFRGENPAKVLYNSKWLGKLKFDQVLDLAAHFTVQQLIERDMFQARLKEGKPIYLHEFLYPLLQGYDSVGMDVDGEIGGNDQTFNMLAGRTLIKQLKNKEKFVIAMKLLVDPSGKKMGKTEGNMITFDDTPEDMFGKVMSWSDGMIMPAFEITTRLPLAEVRSIGEALASGVLHPRDAKLRLAREIVALFAGKRAGSAAAQAFQQAFREGGVPGNIIKKAVTVGTKLVDALAGEFGSKSELRRLFAAGAISEIGGEKIIDEGMLVTRSMKLRIGKHRFVEIALS